MVNRVKGFARFLETEKAMNTKHKDLTILLVQPPAEAEVYEGILFHLHQ